MKPPQVLRRRRELAAGLALLAFASRAPALMAGEPPDSPTRRLDPNRADSAFAAVGSLTAGGGSVYTGVLVAPRYVLTAAHVVPGDPRALAFHLNLGGDLTHTIGIEGAHVHPRFRGFVPPNPPNDLALLELQHDAPGGIVVPRLAMRPPEAGNVIELVGYGASGSGSKGIKVAANAALKRVGLNVIDRVAPGEDGAGRDALLYFFTFDAPERPPFKRSSSLGNLRETGLASGDSGSPAFVHSGGQRGLVGINTFVQRRTDLAAPMSGFGTTGGGQVLHGHRDWLRSVLGPIDGL